MILDAQHYRDVPSAGQRSIGWHAMPTSHRDSSQYFSARPKARSAPRTVSLRLPDASVDLLTDRGVFSPERVDTGTQYLLQAAPGPPEGATDLLDLGCGYGPIAVTLARRCPTATVWATEVNERACELCRTNAARAGVADRVRVEQGPEDAPGIAVLPAGLRFDAIYANPPIRVGKDRLHTLLLDALERLKPGGHAYLVVQKHLGSDSLQRWLTAEGWPTVRLGSRAGYRIFDTTRVGDGSPNAF